MKKHIPILALSLLSSCTSLYTPKSTKQTPPQAIKPVLETKLSTTNYTAFKNSSAYPKTSNHFKDQEVFARTSPENSHIKISLSLQRAFLMNGSEVALDYPVSTGKQSHPTPAGSYKIREKIKDKRSNLYGKVYDASGKVINSSADSRKAKIPEGGKFVGASMPYWMRLTWDGIGMHVGNVPRYPASHACIRGQSALLPSVFSKVKVGTTVTIVE